MSMQPVVPLRRGISLTHGNPQAVVLAFGSPSLSFAEGLLKAFVSMFMASDLITGNDQVLYSSLQPRVTNVMDTLLPLFPQIQTETMIARSRSAQPQTIVLPPSPGDRVFSRSRFPGCLSARWNALRALEVWEEASALPLNLLPFPQRFLPGTTKTTP